MIDFSKKINLANKPKKINPLEIYDSLDRESAAGPLRPVQARVLSKWFEEKRENKDLIVKLHTGAGKTLIGLLMALSCMNDSKLPSLYVCPNLYLMQQACADAKKFGVPFCIVKNNEIPNDFCQAKSILITTVQKVFNGLPIFGIGLKSIKVGCIILDDSHACIDSMMSACTIKLNEGKVAYNSILSLFESELKEQGIGTYQDLKNKKNGVFIPIPYWCWQNHIDDVTSIIAKESDDLNIKFAWPIIKDMLADCYAFISSTKIEIVPFCMPITRFDIFNKAEHRILMSATTQEDTFFIKGLGLSIDSVKEPLIDEDYLWSGEKMILIPEAICEDIGRNEIIKRILEKEHNFGIAIITPSFEKSEKYVEENAVLVNKPGNDIYNTISEFKDDYKNKALVFANRYDGIDLPDNICRLLILDSLPYYDSLSDRYEELCRSRSEIVRIKTIQKIEQGLGRSVRGEKDYSVILIMGSDLIKYIRSITNQKLFSLQTQKQIEIGFQIVDMAKEDLNTDDPDKALALLFSTINQCLDRDEGWKEYYSSQMDSLDLGQKEKDNLYCILQKEKQAFDLALNRNYEKAFELIQTIIDDVSDIYEKGWYLQQAAIYKNHVSQSEAKKIQVKAFNQNNQLLKPEAGVIYNKIKYEINVSRNQRILNVLNEFGDYSELNLFIEDMLGRLSFGVESEKFESAFCELGNLLGYISQRPDKSIRKGPDVLWCVANNKYILIECKNEVLTSRKSISKSEAGQMDEHCGWFEEEYGNANVLNVLVIPVKDLAYDAYFTKDVKIMRKNNLEKLKVKVRKFFKEFQKYDFSSLDLEFIQEKLVFYKFYDEYFLNEFVENTNRKKLDTICIDT